jgi:6-phosphogluconolactonase
MNRTTGALAPIETVVVPGTDVPSPTSLPMALSPDRRFLYAQLRTAPFPVSSFAVDPTTGRLTHRGTTPLVDQMAYLNTDRTGRFLLAASYFGAKLAIYPIDPQGVVAPGATQILDTQPKTHCVVIGGDNRTLYVPVLSSDEVLVLTFDPTRGTVAPNGPGRIASAAGSGPRHLTFHPRLRIAYLLNEASATVATYAIEPGGMLVERQVVETGAYPASAKASDIHVTPDGAFVYAAVRSTSLLYGFRIDPATGTLTPIGRFETEKTPRGFAIDPRGKFLLAVGLDSAGMTVHAIDPATGALTPAHRYPMGTMPNWVEIVDLR